MMVVSGAMVPAKVAGMAGASGVGGGAVGGNYVGGNANKGAGGGSGSGGRGSSGKGASVAINASNPWLIYSACPNVDVSEIGMGYFEGGNAAATRSIGFTVNLAF